MVEERRQLCRNNDQDKMRRKNPQRMNVVDGSCQGSLRMMNREREEDSDSLLMRSKIYYNFAVRNKASSRQSQRSYSLPLDNEIIQEKRMA